MSSKVAVVTGSNKGVGLAIVRALCKQFKGDVYLTSRDVGRGEEACTQLKEEGLNPTFHQLDITDKDSCQKLAAFIKEKYGGLDILVNNAGMAFPVASTAPVSQQAEETVNCNYFGTVNISEALFPLLRAHARVVNVCSRAGYLSIVKNAEIKAKLASDSVTVEEVSKIMNDFVAACKAGNHKEAGWPATTYGMSKVGMSALSRIQSRQMADKDDIIVNFCCPGYVNTDMTSGKGHKTIDEGADTPVYLALLAENCKTPNGQFVAERKVLDWNNGTMFGFRNCVGYLASYVRHVGGHLWPFSAYKSSQ